MYKPINLNIKLLDPNCKPHKGSAHAAAIDLRSREETFTLKFGERKDVHTGIIVDFPVYACGIVMPRSGLGRKYQLMMANTIGLIDPDYRGEIIVSLVAKKEVTIEQYDRFAQLLVLPFIPVVNLLCTDVVSQTERGASGFGDSGVK